MSRPELMFDGWYDREDDAVAALDHFVEVEALPVGVVQGTARDAADEPVNVYGVLLVGSPEEFPGPGDHHVLTAVDRENFERYAPVAIDLHVPPGRRP